MRLPVVDLAAGAERAVARALREASATHGFFYVAGHGVAREVVAEAFAEMEGFFEDSQAKKACAGAFRGYVGLFEQGDYGVDESDVRQERAPGSAAAEKLLVGEQPLDFKEMFHFGTTLPRSHEMFHDLLFAPNVWPPQRPRFREALQTYYNAVLGLSDEMLQLFALSLDLPKRYFVDMARSTPMNSMNCVHYPPLSAFPKHERPLSEAQLGIGAHTDFEAVTLLSQHGPTDACLDILVDGAWHPVPPLADHFVVNVGDMLARASGDIFRSTVHRARNHATQHRFSIAFFRAPDFDANISPRDIAAPRRQYEPLQAGVHMLRRVAKANEPNLIS
ncbi:2-oxoglutarate-dependent dioxygenase asL3 (Xenovulene A biosynthesis cluster protein L3) [Durusdinium trenchii]|uniref:2-oxoglutarate-dependent dioxygenase asL3 (Xenovulene A biosynthesis cluster protein L3) n=1 Tax=Durusdinium trenchii TaxID=1381693 RepID=A0ABP0K9N5_9DINO